MIFYNSLSRKKELFKPIDKKLITLYTCGPTVYDSPHIGNYRTFLFEDLLKRTLIIVRFHCVGAGASGWITVLYRLSNVCLSASPPCVSISATMPFPSAALPGPLSHVCSLPQGGAPLQHARLGLRGAHPLRHAEPAHSAAPGERRLEPGAALSEHGSGVPL